MKILLIGPPASGKGTIGNMLSQKLDIPLISGGALLRALPQEHPRYTEVHALMSRGELVPQDFLASLYKEKVASEASQSGFILDGWGRKLIDLEIYDPGFDFVVVFTLSRDSALKRITGRRMCKTDGQIYNIYTLPTEKLKECEGDLVQRADDKEDVVNRRLDLYEIESGEVLEYLSERYQIVYVDSEPHPDDVFVATLQAMGIK